MIVCAPRTVKVAVSPLTTESQLNNNEKNFGSREPGFGKLKLMSSHTGGGGGSGSGGSGGGGGSGVSVAAKKEVEGAIARALDKMMAPLSPFLPKKFLNPIVSFFNKWLIEDPVNAAVSRSEELIQKYPMLKSELFLGSVSSLAAWIEDEAKLCKEPGSEILLVKVSDALETAVPALRNAAGIPGGQQQTPATGHVHADSKTAEKLGALKVETLKKNRDQLMATPDEAKAKKLRKRQEANAVSLAKSEHTLFTGPPAPRKPAKPPTPPKPPGVPIGTKMLGAVKKVSGKVDSSGVLQPVNQGLQNLADWFRTH